MRIGTDLSALSVMPERIKQACVDYALAEERDELDRDDDIEYENVTGAARCLTPTT